MFWILCIRWKQDLEPLNNKTDIYNDEIFNEIGHFPYGYVNGQKYEDVLIKFFFAL